MSLTDPAVGVAVVETDNSSDRSYVDWPAIFAGAVFATAVSVVLLAFGSAVGLTLTSPYEGEGVSVAWLAIAGGLWLLWVQVSSFFAGAYLSGRMRRRFHDSTPHEKDVRDGSHGLLVWGVGTLVGAMLTLSGISGVASKATDTAATVAAGTMAAGAAAASKDGPYDMLVDRIFRSGDPSKPSKVAAATRNEAGRILTSSLVSGDLAADDRQYLVDLVSSTANIDQPAAAQRVDKLVADAKAAEAKAKAAAESARKFAVLVAFMTAASLLVSGAAAYYAATLGGQHRDEGAEFSDWYRPR